MRQHNRVVIARVYIKWFNDFTQLCQVHDRLNIQLHPDVLKDDNYLKLKAQLRCIFLQPTRLAFAIESPEVEQLRNQTQMELMQTIMEEQTFPYDELELNDVEREVVVSTTEDYEPIDYEDAVDDALNETVHTVIDQVCNPVTPKKRKRGRPPKKESTIRSLLVSKVDGHNKRRILPRRSARKSGTAISDDSDSDDSDWELDVSNDENISSKSSPVFPNVEDITSGREVAIPDKHSTSESEKGKMLTFNDNKAGMMGLNKEHINRIIETYTSGNYSDFYKRQQEKVHAKISTLKKCLENVSPTEWVKAEKEMDELAARLECGRDLRRDCVHIDMDAYFAAVEMRDEPRLRTVPMAVGTSAMLSTSNYLARRFGVRAAMPGFIAKKLCPQLVLVAGNYSKYRKESLKFEAIFSEYDEDLSMGSLDEAYLDITDYVSAKREPSTFVQRRYGGDCICKLPLTSGADVTPKSTETCVKCGKERKVFEDNVEFGVSRSEVCYFNEF
ncbi:hypothetical protein DICVIV_12914 [Dictyocaulus viviparus]|uniref:UmuC domain-containing protein n=1 Tax=Dictyocaulus viviparus TaxID=29172 RepID=A0A0D8XBS3_DICVI|nr:hypothetical protein DICVIV_12914 [Dictyocaulus viviparus]